VNDLANTSRRNSPAKTILYLAIIGVAVVALSVLVMAGMFLSLNDKYSQLQQNYTSLQTEKNSLNVNYTNSQQELAIERDINNYLQNQIGNATQQLGSLSMKTAYCSYSIGISYENQTIIFPQSSNINSQLSTIKTVITGINLTRIGSESQVDAPWLVQASALRAIPGPNSASGSNILISTDAFRSNFYENEPPVWLGPIVEDYNSSSYDVHDELYNLTLTGLIQITYYSAESNVTFYFDHGDGSPYGDFTTLIQ